MDSTTYMITRLKADFPNLTFQASDVFLWSPSEKTVYYDSSQLDEANLLHELSHAVLNHSSYAKDIQLLEMESQAWDYAKHQLAPQYNIQLEEDTIQEALDTYRNWLHQRSRCPNCDATGVESAKNNYICLACDHRWRVNDARTCALRRYSL